MKNEKLIISILSIALLLSINSESYAQATGDNNPGANKFLGYNGAQNLDFKTNDILRMFLMRTQSNTINGWPGIVQDGYLGLSDQTNFGVGPASMIHLNGGNSGGPQYNGFRPWMKYGTTITANDDLMYIGQKADSLNKSDAVIAWSDNGSNSEFGPDNLRFIFTGEWDYGGENTSHTEGGQEVMRISPAPEANMGVGNFSSNGLGESPTERVDVDGTARLRRVSNDSLDVIITGVYAEDPGVDGDYVLNYSTLEDIGDQLGIQCDWEVVNADQDVATGYPTACVPGRVLVGDPNPVGNSKVYMTKDYPGITLEVNATVGGDNHEIGGFFTAENSNYNNYGVRGHTQRGRTNYGVEGVAGNALGANYGLHGIAVGPGPLGYGVFGSSRDGTTLNFGTFGLANGNNATPLNNVGAYGRAMGNAKVTLGATLRPVEQAQTSAFMQKHVIPRK